MRQVFNHFQRKLKIADKITPVTIALAMIAISIVILLLGFTHLHSQSSDKLTNLVQDLYANGGAELLSIAITVLIIDTLNKKRSEDERKRELILQMGSPSNDFAIEAVRLLDHHNWVKDGSLRKQFFTYANLENVILLAADFSHSTIIESTFKNAELEDTTFHGCRFEYCNFENIEFAHINMSDSELIGCFFRNANMSNIHPLNWKNTILPDGTIWTPDTDMEKFTNPEHPNFYVPEYDDIKYIKL